MAQWNPWREMEELRREIDRAFERFGLEVPLFRSAFLPGRGTRDYPLVNLYEDPEAVRVEALAPGVDPRSFNVSVARDTLTLSGEKRRAEGDMKPEAFHREERGAGKFSRTIQLPAEVDDSRVEAAYRDGLLLITLPKAEKAKPRRISVQVA
jgi:HSP20 family protein